MFLPKSASPDEPSKKGFVFPTHTNTLHTTKVEPVQPSLFGSLKQESGNSIAIGPGGTKIEVLAFQPKTEITGGMFGSASKSSLFQVPSTNLFQQKSDTQSSAGNIFTNNGESSK